MNVGHTLTCFFFLTLRDGNTGLINAEIPVHTGTEGGNITVGCSFYLSGVRKIFCKDECEGKDILVETTGDRAQSGRYSIEYIEGTFPLISTLLYVSITKLTKSDSGRYRCSLDRFLIPDSSEEFEIRVTDATGVQLYVRLILVVMIIVSSVVVLIFCRKRASKPKEPHVEMEYATVTKPSRVSEEIREEDRESRSPPVEISTL
ncbi:uncharacterized protein LOC122882587 isoform X2 [Siniperca chuatsi]|uniref:uncharacterized protein LOC122882587 isoform X2 n=1 Tax=Siniperca chuatsi TaxID=119488 RepID=UPI001CE19229|nr:uncharacterized protein LOC122882587 isoform X2 [Siniperca chuatsi]